MLAPTVRNALPGIAMHGRLSASLVHKFDASV